MDELAEHNWHRFADSDVASPGLPHSSQVLYSCLRSFKVVHGRACILAALFIDMVPFFTASIAANMDSFLHCSSCRLLPGSLGLGLGFFGLAFFLPHHIAS